MLVAAAPLGLAPLSRDQVSCRHDRIGNQRAGVESLSDRHQPAQRLLHHVIDGVRLMEPRSNDSPKHRGELNDVGVVGTRRRLLAHRSFTLVLQKSSDPASCRPEHRVYLVRDIAPTLQRTPSCTIAGTP